jgi:hypothetical protein
MARARYYWAPAPGLRYCVFDRDPKEPYAVAICPSERHARRVTAALNIKDRQRRQKKEA